MEKETIFGTVPSKSNSYTVGRVNGHSCIVKSNEVKRYEREFLRQCTIYKGKGISTPFRLVVDVYYPDYTHDLDGCFKALLDLLQACGVCNRRNKRARAAVFLIFNTFNVEYVRILLYICIG